MGRSEPRRIQAEEEGARWLQAVIESNRLLQFQTEVARRLQARTEGLTDSWLGRKKVGKSRQIRRELCGSRLAHGSSGVRLRSMTQL